MLKDLARLTRETREHSRKMQHRLLQYWCSMALVLFGVLLVILSMTGILSRSEKEFHKALEIYRSSAQASLNSHMDLLEAQNIALSESTRAVLEDCLYARPVSTFNDEPDALLQLQKDLYGPLNTALKVSPCSGAYIMVDATTNTKAPHAEISRSGLYLRFANLSTVQAAKQEVTLFRGIPQVGREAGVRMHNRWNLEFDTEKFPGYEKIMAQSPDRLANACLWLPRTNLPDTWEDIMFLSVPIFDSNGQAAGLCGMELSSQYFRLAYPSQVSEYGPVITMLAPVRDGQLLVEQGLIGDAGGTLVDSLDYLNFHEGKHYNTYSCQDVSYLGLHQLLDSKTVDGDPLAVAVLVPQEGFIHAMNWERATWVMGTMIFLIIMVILSIYLSRGFVKPILSALDSIRNRDWEEGKTGSYLEINDLFDFLAEKDQEHDELLRTLEQEKKEAQNRAESVQAELKKLSEGRKITVDADEYQLFLDGLATLTPTERGIFNLYLSGYRAKEILELLSIKENTLKYHNRNIYSKLGVSSRKQLLEYAALMKQKSEETQQEGSEAHATENSPK